MKIAILNNLYQPFNKGGAEKIVRLMIGRYQAAGHEVFLITTRPRGKKAPENNQIKTYHLLSGYYNLGRWPHLYRLFWQVGNLLNIKKEKEIKRILDQEKPELITTHNLMGLGFLAPRAIRSRHIRHEHFLHDVQLLHPSGLMIYGQEKKISAWPARLYQSLTRCLFASPDLITSPSRWLMLEHEKRGFFPHSKKEIQPYDWLEEQKNEGKETKEKKSFLYCGQMVEAKGIFPLIEAFQKNTDPGARLTMIGNGSEAEKAKKAAATDSRILVLSWSEQAEDDALSRCSTLIVPSLCYENSPTIIAKARARGLRVIANNLGGIPEMLGPGDELFEPGNIEELAEKIKESGK